MGFNWKSVLGTIVPTIGTVVGKLLGVSNDDCALLYQFTNQDDTSCEASIVKKDGKIILWNRSENENGVITLSLPKVGTLEPQTFTLKQGQSIELDSLFRDCANHDSTKLMISASNNEEAIQKGVDNASEQFHICAAASDVCTDGNTPVRLGSYLTVVCSREKAIFTSANHQIIHISVANFQGRNDQKIKLMDIPAAPQNSGTVVEVKFPSEFPEGTVLDIDVEVEMGGLTNIMEAQKSWCNIRSLNPDEITQLKSIPVIH